MGTDRQEQSWKRAEHPLYAQLGRISRHQREVHPVQHYLKYLLVCIQNPTILLAVQEAEAWLSQP